MMAASDLIPSGFNLSGNDLSVTFDVTEAAVPAFDIGVYSSTDGSTLGTLLMSHRVTNSADRTLGNGHVVSFQANFTDLTTDYSLLVKLDSSGEITESSESNNNRLFYGGVFQAANGDVHVHGTHSTDTVTIGQTSQVSVTLNGVTNNFTTLGVQSLRVRGQAGADTITGDNNVTKQIYAFGGTGNDSITSGAAADFIYGGGGDDTLYGLDGNDTIHGQSGYDLLYGGAGDDFLWGGVGIDGIDGGGQENDDIYDAPTLTFNFNITSDGYLFYGTVSDDASHSGCYVRLGGDFFVSVATINVDGTFSYLASVSGTGTVTAFWVDAEGLTSEVSTLLIT